MTTKKEMQNFSYTQQQTTANLLAVQFKKITHGGLLLVITSHMVVS